MQKLLLNPTPTAQWHALVSEAQHAAEQPLNETLESYLIFLLIRFMDKPEFVNRVLAIDYLESLLKDGQRRRNQLRDIGDQCLLFSGLFPQRAKRKRVRISYYVDLGRSSYHALSEQLNDNTAELFDSLSKDFVLLMDTLQTMRAIGTGQSCLTPLDAYHLWNDTNSRGAYLELRHYTTASPWTNNEQIQKNPH